MASITKQTVQVAAFIDRCKTAAKDQDYKLALEEINNALRISKDHKAPTRNLLDLLDYRHAIYLKQDDHAAALKDAKYMIRLDRTDARGYIRAGMLEVHRNRGSLGLGFLQHGLKNVPKSDANYKLLAKEEKTVKDEMAALLLVDGARDPMTTLPLEIIELILQYLDYRTLTRQMRVCRTWRRLICAMPPIIDTLAFPQHSRPVTPKMLLASFRHLKICSTMKLEGLTPQSLGILRSRLTHSSVKFKNPEHFEVVDDCCGNIYELPPMWSKLRTLIVHNYRSCPFNAVWQLLNNMPELVVAKIHVDSGGRRSAIVPLKSLSLREFELYNHNSVSGVPRAVLHLSMPNLRTMVLSAVTLSNANFQHMKYLESLSLVDCAFPEPTLPLSLRAFRMHSSGFTDIGAFLLGQSGDRYPPLPNLESVAIRGGHRLNVGLPNFLYHGLTKTPSGNLRQLAITELNVEGGNPFDNLEHESFSTVTAFTLAYTGLKDDHISNLQKCFPALEKLQIVEAPDITGIFVTRLITASDSKLREVILQGCGKVGRDIVTWGAERGVTVQLRSTPTIVRENAHRVREW